MNKIDLIGEHAVVTGAAQGLGFAMAKRFVASGATVTLWDIDEAQLAIAKNELGDAVTTRVVNVADWESVDAARAKTEESAAAYSASKAAVIGMTKSLGKELAQYDIAVNCITPATAQTRILEQLTPQHIEYMRSRIPRGRLLEVDEAASKVAWLVSRENSFTTASTFDLSGGRTTY